YSLACPACHSDDTGGDRPNRALLHATKCRNNERLEDRLEVACEFENRYGRFSTCPKLALPSLTVGLLTRVVAAVNRAGRCRASSPNLQLESFQSHPTDNRRGKRRLVLCSCISDNRCTGKDRLRCGRREGDLRRSPRTCTLRWDNTLCTR